MLVWELQDVPRLFVEALGMASLSFIKTFLAAIQKMDRIWSRENILNILPQQLRWEMIEAGNWVVAVQMESGGWIWDMFQKLSLQILQVGEEKKWN